MTEETSSVSRFVYFGIGTLISFDQTLNIILNDWTERVYESDEVAVQAVKMNLYCIRGDNVAIIGEIDLDVEDTIDYAYVKANPIEPMNIF